MTDDGETFRRVLAGLGLNFEDVLARAERLLMEGARMAVEQADGDPLMATMDLMFAMMRSQTFQSPMVTYVLLANRAITDALLARQENSDEGK